ncbi:MAG: hypothetical protein DRI90_28455, partial [Deltaproteobacteria bacterium]
ARPISTLQLQLQTSPGVFTNDLSLSGSLNSQAALVWDNDNNEYIGMEGGTVYRWAASGSSLSNVTLVGYGTLNSESSYPNNRGVAWASGYYLTYSNGVLSAWDSQGARIDTTNLTGAGITFDSHFSISYAQGKAWVVDDNNGIWRGYDVGI